MKKLLSLLLLLTPLISSAMSEQQKQQAIAVTSDDDDACTIYTTALRNMTYHDLKDELLKKGFEAAIQIALTKGEALLTECKSDSDKKERKNLTVVLLGHAQFKLADIMDYQCANTSFEVNAEAVFKGISKKYEETNAVGKGKKKKNAAAPDMDAYATLTFMLEHYKDLTGTTRKDMLKGSELIAKRMVEKTMDAQAFASAAPSAISLEKK